MGWSDLLRLLRLLWLLYGNSDRCGRPCSGRSGGRALYGCLLEGSHHLGWIGRENGQGWWRHRRLLLLLLRALNLVLLLLNNCFAEQSHLLVMMVFLNFLLLFSMFQDSIDFLFRFLFDLKIIIGGCCCCRGCRDCRRCFQLILGATATSGAAPLSASHNGSDHCWR